MRVLKKTLITILIYSIVLFCFYSLIYGFKYQIDSISNVLFIIGFLSFGAGLLSVTNAQNVFIGFRYFFKNLFKPKDEEKISFYEFKEEKYQEKHTYVSKLILFVGLFLIIIAIVLAITYLR